MRIFRCKCVFLGVIWVFLGVILQNLPGGMTAHPPRMVVRKLVCDVTQLWRNLPPLRNFLRTPLNAQHVQDFFWNHISLHHAKIFCSPFNLKRSGSAALVCSFAAVAKSKRL